MIVVIRPGCHGAGMSLDGGAPKKCVVIVVPYWSVPRSLPTRRHPWVVTDDGEEDVLEVGCFSTYSTLAGGSSVQLGRVPFTASPPSYVDTFRAAASSSARTDRAGHPRGGTGPPFSPAEDLVDGRELSGQADGLPHLGSLRGDVER